MSGGAALCVYVLTSAVTNPAFALPCTVGRRRPRTAGSQAVFRECNVATIATVGTQNALECDDTSHDSFQSKRKALD